MIKLLISLVALKCSQPRIVDHSGKGFNYQDSLAFKRAIKVCASGRYGSDNKCLTSFIKKKNGHLVALCGPKGFKHKRI